MKYIYYFVQMVALLFVTFGIAFLAAVATPNNTQNDGVCYEEGAYRYFEPEFKEEVQ